MLIKIDPIHFKEDENFIFISYCHEDEDFIKNTLNWLKKNNYRFWFDGRIIRGYSGEDEFLYHNRYAAVNIIFGSSTYFNKEKHLNCIKELEDIRKFNKEFIFIESERNLKIPLEYDTFIHSKQFIRYIDFFNVSDYYTLLRTGKNMDLCLNKTHKITTINLTTKKTVNKLNKLSKSNKKDFNRESKELRKNIKTIEVYDTNENRHFFTSTDVIIGDNTITLKSLNYDYKLFDVLDIKYELKRIISNYNFNIDLNEDFNNFSNLSSHAYRDMKVDESHIVNIFLEANKRYDSYKEVINSINNKLIFN